jgi:hypothetical protein
MCVTKIYVLSVFAENSLPFLENCYTIYIYAEQYCKKQKLRRTFQPHQRPNS